MLKQLQHLMDHGVLRPLDLQFAKFIAQQEKIAIKISSCCCLRLQVMN